MTLDSKWITDLNHRFPNIGDEFKEAIAQKFAREDADTDPAELIRQFIGDPDYMPGVITNAKSFGLHSNLMLLYPVVGKYQEALQEAKLLRDFILQHPPDNPDIILTFRGVYAELLIINEQFEQAIQECNETLAKAPDEEGMYLSRGVAHIHLKRLDAALEDLKILIQHPDPDDYARALFSFLLHHRDPFQEQHIQSNTMLDMMIKDLSPQTDTRIKIPAQPKPAVPSTPESPDVTQPPPATVQTAAVETEEAVTPPDHVETSLQVLLEHSLDTMEQVLGTPQFESETEATIERDYPYHENTITIGFDKASGEIIALQMFFMPSVDEATAFARIGLKPRDLDPSISTDVLKVWSPYGEYAKVRLSIDGEQVMAIIVEP